MSDLLTVEKTLEVLDRLRETVRDFATREARIEHEFATLINRARKQREFDSEQVRARVASQVEMSAMSVASAWATIEARHRTRHERIVKALQSSRRQRHEESVAREGRRRHKVQTETLNANRHRDQSIAAANNALAQFQGEVAAENGALGQIDAAARSALGGFKKLARQLGEGQPAADAVPEGDEIVLLGELRNRLAALRGDVERFQKVFLPAFFKLTWLWLVAVVALVPAVWVIKKLEIKGVEYQHGLIAAGACIALGFVLRLVAAGQARPHAASLGVAFANARKLHDACLERAAARHAQELDRIEKEFQARGEALDAEWNAAVQQAENDRATWPARLDEKAARCRARADRIRDNASEILERNHAETSARLEENSQSSHAAIEATCAGAESAATQERDARWLALAGEWKPKIDALYSTITAAGTGGAQLFPPWDSGWCTSWKPPAQFGNAAQFGRLDVDVAKLAEAMPRDSRLALPGPSRFPMPLMLTYPNRGSILFETSKTGREEMIGALNDAVLRLLSIAPAGRLSFTIIDPVGLGQSFSGVMHLADYADHLINSRIWTQSGQIEQRLADLNEHMEKVIQMYLRNEYATIAEYNEQAGNIAEKYHFLVVADFPAGFTEVAAKRLLSIAASGARCGVFTLIHWDRRLPVPQDFVPDDLRKSSVCVAHRGTEITLGGRVLPGAALVLEQPPAPEAAVAFIHKVGVSHRDSNRVEVPFSHITPPPEALWTVETTSELRVPIGRSGATKLQYLAIGKGTRQHALLAGKTGSGKSTLFHVMITNLALWCSPEQVEFYLIDFKKGVEFKCYASRRLPHARVIAIESDREFGLSVLQKLDDELRRRGDMFRRLGAQDIAGYKRAGGTGPMPRSLLLVDEFQELFVEDDKISQTASMLLDRIVRQGRAFGIHVILGSQTLGGAYTVARTTLGQMVIRIALQCNEADAYLIMDENNPAPRLLSRPGEGIYNDAAGAVEGNSPFQAVWLPDEVRDACLDQVIEQAHKRGANYPGPIVFEGNAPSDIRENPLLRDLLAAPAVRRTDSPRIWLGAPNSIKGPTEAVFHRQSGNNLVIVGQRDEAALAMMSIALVSLAAQYQRDAVRIIVCDGSAPGTSQREFLDRVVRMLPHRVIAARQGDLPQVMKELGDDLTRRGGDETAPAPPVFLVIHGLQKFNKLRYEEDFSFGSSDPDAPPNPALLLNTILCEGARHGIHVIATCDTYNNVNRFLSRKAFAEFELRILFQMSANDSASLIDSPRASALGLHRALFYNEAEGQIEVFRPYALPDNEWLDEAAASLARLAGEKPAAS